MALAYLPVEGSVDPVPPALLATVGLSAAAAGGARGRSPRSCT